VQVNVVVIRGVNDDELGDFVELTRHAAVNVRFIEYMPFDGNVWAEPKLLPYADMLAAVRARFPQGLQRLVVRCACPENPREQGKLRRGPSLMTVPLACKAGVLRGIDQRVLACGVCCRKTG
jgi:hypothetical protein